MSKIINDPVHGFIDIKYKSVQQCIDHPYFQRLRNISQLGLTHFVYPGAHHSRFHHALGAYHLVQIAMERLIGKGIEITEKEAEAVSLAILLHDIGHGPYSHALEKSFFKQISHEQVSLYLMEDLNQQMKGALDLAIEIFANRYEKKFLYQLISSQLDVDRLDYLKRDSFYTGVVEGNIGVDRILAMIDVRENEIVVHEKGIMSVQDFLLSRNLMYWQVYLHKTVLSAENMLVNLFRRIQELKENGENFNTKNDTLNFFFQLSEKERATLNSEVIERFICLDDSDVWILVKELRYHTDSVLSFLANSIINRKFYKVYNQKEAYIQAKKTIPTVFKNREEYFAFEEHIDMIAYSDSQPIRILLKNGEIKNYDDYVENSGYLLNMSSKTRKSFYYAVQSS